MSRILIWKQAATGCEYNIFSPTDYKNLYLHVQSEWGGICKNWGNRLWFQGIYSAIDTGENQYDFISEEIDIDRINSEYDLILLPMANIFYCGFLESMRHLTDIFEKIKVPTFVVVCGVQASSYDAMDEVIDVIGADSARFIRAIYNTGGEFALRGYFTKEFFERLGFFTAVVTGCPSLYQLGPDFVVSVNKVPQIALRPVFNGHIPPLSALLQAYPESVFIDQDEFFLPMYQPDYLSDPSLGFKLNFINRYGMEAAKLLGQGRIKLIADMNDWWNYLQDAQFNYSFGSRIHGTIMSLLSGIPATVVVCDSRTREMAEFFDIPLIQMEKGHCFTQAELVDTYSKMDYKAFNSNFERRFKAYEEFLVSRGIVSSVNTKNKFFARGGDRSFEDVPIANQSAFADFFANLQKNRQYLTLANQAQKVIKRIF